MDHAWLIDDLNDLNKMAIFWHRRVVSKRFLSPCIPDGLFRSDLLEQRFLRKYGPGVARFAGIAQNELARYWH